MYIKQSHNDPGPQLKQQITLSTSEAPYPTPLPPHSEKKTRPGARSQVKKTNFTRLQS